MSNGAIQPKDVKTLQEYQILMRQEIKTYKDWPKPGVDFKDIQSVLADRQLAELTTQYLLTILPTEPDGSFAFDKILCFDARGFIFGFYLSQVARVPMIMARKPGKLPGDVITQTFQKEYGMDEIQVQSGLILPGDRVLIHDDLLATGGTSAAAAEIILNCKAYIAGFNFIMELESLQGKDVLKKYTLEERINSLLTF